MQPYRSPMALLLLLCVGGLAAAPSVSAQELNARMQQVLAKFVEATGDSVMGVGSWIGGKTFDPRTSDFDMRLVITQGGTEAQQLARWQHARSQMATLIKQEFGAQAGDILRRTNLYAPNQLMQGIENSADAMTRFQELRTVPNLAHQGAVTSTTTAKYAEGLYGAGAQTYVQGYEKAAGRLFYSNNGKCVTGLSELAHLGEEAGAYNATGTANTAGQWAEHALAELEAGRGDKVAKYLERLERDLVKSRSLSKLPVDEAYRAQLRKMRDLLKSSPGKLPGVSEGVAQLLRRGEAEAALLKGFENAGPVRQAYLRVMLDGLTLKNKVGQLIGQIMAKTPSWVNAENAMNYVAICIGTQAAAQSAGRGDNAFAALSNVSGALNPLKLIGPALLAEITAEVILQAREGGFALMAGFQGAWNLMEGIYSAWGRVDVDPDPRRKLTLDDMVAKFQEESKLEAVVMAQAIRASTRNLGTANEQSDEGVANAIFAKCWPTIRAAWRWERDLLTSEYLQLASEIVHTPLVIYYTPQAPKAGEPLVCEVRSLDGKLADRLNRMTQIIRVLYGKTSGVAANYYWEPTGTAVGDRDWQRGFAFASPGKYPVKVRLEVAPFTQFAPTEFRVMLRRSVPALVDVVVAPGAAAPKAPEPPGSGTWVLVTKEVRNDLKPGSHTSTAGDLTQTNALAGQVGEGSVSVTETYEGSRPKARTRGSLAGGSYVEPAHLKVVRARQATWTPPPARLEPGAKLTVNLNLTATGSSVSCDPPGAQGDGQDVKSGGTLDCALALGPSKEQSAGGGNPTHARVLAQLQVRTGDPAKSLTVEVPARDPSRDVLTFAVSFSSGLMGAGTYSARYEYRLQAAAPTAPAGDVTDLTGALTAAELGDLRQALASLTGPRGLRLAVVFTGPLSPEQAAQQAGQHRERMVAAGTLPAVCGLLLYSSDGAKGYSRHQDLDQRLPLARVKQAWEDTSEAPTLPGHVTAQLRRLAELLRP